MCFLTVDFLTMCFLPLCVVGLDAILATGALIILPVVEAIGAALGAAADAALAVRAKANKEVVLARPTKVV